MTGTEYRGRRGRAHFSSAPSARGFLRGMTIAVLLAIVAAILQGIPVAQAQTFTRLSMVTIQPDGKAYHRWSVDFSTSWSPWTNLVAPAGTTLFGSPAMASDGLGRLNIVAKGDLANADGSLSRGLLHNHFNGNWSGWIRIPGLDDTGGICIGSACYTFYGAFSQAVASWGPGHMDLFVSMRTQAVNGSSSVGLLHTSTDNYSWSGAWEVVGSMPLSNLTQGPVGAISWGPGRIDVFMEGPNNELEHKWFDNGQWSSGWENLGGILTSPPVIASPGPGLLIVMTRGTDGHLWVKWFDSNLGWGDWGDVGCCLAGDANVANSVAATSTSTGASLHPPHPSNLDAFAFVIGTQHDLYYKNWRQNRAGGWTDWLYLDHLFDYTNIAVAAWPDAAPDNP
jgi:Repeat of unknown function (DUF346)